MSSSALSEAYTSDGNCLNQLYDYLGRRPLGRPFEARSSSSAAGAIAARTGDRCTAPRSRLKALTAAPRTSYRRPVSITPYWSSPYIKYALSQPERSGRVDSRSQPVDHGPAQQTIAIGHGDQGAGPPRRDGDADGPGRYTGPAADTASRMHAT